MKRLVLFIFLAFLFKIGFTQNDSFKSTFSLSTGYSLADKLYVDNNEADNEFITSLYPLIQVGYHYSINKRFSVGALVASQFLVMNYSSYNGETVDFKKTLIINNYAIRGLVHYALKYKVKMYSGLRIGAIDFMLETDYDLNGDLLIRDTNASKTVSFATQFILLGLQTKLSDHVGANMEICAGQPYFVSLGLTYSL